jgi:hypothetical protein
MVVVVAAALLRPTVALASVVIICLWLLRHKRSASTPTCAGSDLSRRAAVRVSADDKAG